MRNFLTLKTSWEKIKQMGSLFDAIKGDYYINVNRASKCSHVIAIIKGSKEVHGVFKIDEWKHAIHRRYRFKGTKDTALENKLLGKTLNSKLFIKGRRNPVAYLTEDELLEA